MVVHEDDFPTQPVTTERARQLLVDEEEDRGELTYEQRLALDIASGFHRMDADASEELAEELLDLERVNQELANKIADMAPLHEDDVLAAFQDQRYTPDADQIERIITLVREYLY